MAAKKAATKTKAATSKRVTFKINAPEANEVFIAGDFNEWDVKSKQLKKGKNGSFSGIVSLKPGMYQYRFLVDSSWVTDMDSETVSNDFGSLNNVKRI